MVMTTFLGIVQPLTRMAEHAGAEAAAKTSEEPFGKMSATRPTDMKLCSSGVRRSANAQTAIPPSKEILGADDAIVNRFYKGFLRSGRATNGPANALCYSGATGSEEGSSGSLSQPEDLVRVLEALVHPKPGWM
jgi:hypothetical protein